MTAKRKTRKKYVNPVRQVLTAAQKAEALRHEVYSFELCQQIVEHNRTVLMPALVALMQWAVELEGETRYLEAKRQEASRGKK